MHFAILVTLSFIPTIIAVCRKHPNSLAIFVINLLLGWTIIGWFVALFMSLGNATKRQQQPQIVIVNQNGNDSVAPVMLAPPAQQPTSGRGQPRPWLEALLPKKDSQRTLA